MPSTYTTNLGIELPADGELDGIWGDVVNDNMDILDRAINGSVTLSLSGTSSNLTTTDGTLSNGQYKLLVLGGTPSGTHTITIAPSDAQKIYFVYNLSGQSVVFAQGSGTTVTLANGDSGVIYSDGGGGAAGVFNVTDHFAMNSVKITGGTITGITDLAVADGGTGVSTLTGLVKGNGTSAFSAAVAGTDFQAPITGAATTITSSDLTVSRALVSDGSGKVAVSSVTATELGYLSGITGVTPRTSSTGSSVVSTGTTLQRDGSPSAGFFRFNSTLGKFEGYSGTAWGSVGGGATGGGSDELFIENGQTMTTNYTIPSTKNAMSTGPITINSGVTLTVDTGARYVVI
jgi:hypothetical protein